MVRKGWWVTTFSIATRLLGIKDTNLFDSPSKWEAWAPRKVGPRHHLSTRIDNIRTGAKRLDSPNKSFRKSPINAARSSALRLRMRWLQMTISCLTAARNCAVWFYQQNPTSPCLKSRHRPGGLSQSATLVNTLPFESRVRFHSSVGDFTSSL